MNTSIVRSFATVVFAGTIAIVPLAGCTGMQNDFMRELLNPGIDVSAPAPGPLNDRAMTAGLKEALRVAIERTVDATSKTDGFLGDPAIRIPLPGEFDTAGSTSLPVGFDCQVDRFEISMNRAAEHAAGEARGVFLDALDNMTISEPADMIEGCNAAATDSFRAKTSDALMEQFRSIVSKEMTDVGLYRLYDRIHQRTGALVSATAPAKAVNLDEYVTQYALDGLFTVMAREETRIRQDPDARTTSLLRRVFGNN